MGSRDSGHTLRTRATLLLVALVLVPVGFGTKAYTGLGEEWVRYHVGGMVYVVFWCIVGKLGLMRVDSRRVVAGVLALTCIVEVTQLWHPSALEGLRGSTVGSALIGQEFDWWDFPHYAAGAFVGLVGLRWLVGEGEDNDGIS